MTAEIAVMNKLAIALAADSAVTITKELGEKIYYTVDKLFSLSNDHPIGIMIYGNAEFMEVPWETIIGAYKKHVGSTKFNSLEEYGTKLINFIQNNRNLIGEKQENTYLNESIMGYLSSQRNAITEKIEEVLKTKTLTTAEIEDIGEKILLEEAKEWQKYKYLKFATKAFIAQLRKKTEPELAQCKDIIFEKFPLSKKTEAILSEMVIDIFCKDRFKNSSSGIVIAGFGEKQYFPSVISYEFEGEILGKIKYKVGNKCAISQEIGGYVVPFAQSYMVYSFMEGIDPNLQREFEKYNSIITTTYPEIIAQKIPLDPKVKKDEVVKKLKDAGNALVKSFNERLKEYKKRRHHGPITRAVSAMPKKELISMAEALVQLTSLKQRFSLESETVGGPINVAIISKSEGFVWVKKDSIAKSAI